ncbi:Thymidylate kinase [Acromyrmex echinatior]|uniref:Thymidylate kinase n=1 Tax=Acromyrmex echinatior TaxID=103372 RepID=F4W5P3_ACREC|nr:Thymidylate kinase [Acromyrmex echinatior]
MYKRGALIVLEGCDRTDRKTPVGTILNSFLSKEINVPLEAAHLLFSANRWECKEDMEKTLQSSTRCPNNNNKNCMVTEGKKGLSMTNFNRVSIESNYEKLRDDTWVIINANQDESAMHAEISQKTLSVIQEVVQYRSIELLSD